MKLAPGARDEKSRSQIKRDIRALKELGIRLAGLSDGQLSAIPLTDETRVAVLAAQRMARNARQRHYRYLSSLLAEEDVAAIRSALAGELQPHVEDVAKLHEAERWRDTLLSGDEGQLTAFVEHYPSCDRARVRRLVREKSARELFRYVRRLSDARG